jgi:hypothetical protein
LRRYTKVKKLPRGYMTGEFLLEAATAPAFDTTHIDKTVFQATADSMSELADRLTA